jgi:hypothetical protein
MYKGAEQSEPVSWGFRRNEPVGGLLEVIIFCTFRHPITVKFSPKRALRGWHQTLAAKTKIDRRRYLTQRPQRRRCSMHGFPWQDEGSEEKLQCSLSNGRINITSLILELRKHEIWWEHQYGKYWLLKMEMENLQITTFTATAQQIQRLPLYVCL